MVPNLSTQSPYINVLGDQILHFFKIVYYFFRIFENQCFQKIVDHQKSVIFKNSKKITNNFQKNIKFGLQAQFNMKINLNGSDRLFEL